MAELPDMMVDLALILTVAGVVTLLFKRLKQPLVLGYVVAGFLTSPHMPYTPSVHDLNNIHLWADLGVIFLLFALGLEFSFKKIVKMGSSPVIAACTIIFCMMGLGFLAGKSFGWAYFDCLFLGGMLAMSSTTIIYKAFDDLGLRQQRFTGLVLSVLILEDILAILLMVILSTVAVSRSVEGEQLMLSMLKLVFFLVLWFVVGIYLIPQFLKYNRRIMSEETLLIVALGMCFAMVVLASYTGFSAAFGAFMMGSILAETVEAEKIEHLVSPVKDLFGAVFFVSVGMLVDPAVLVDYWFPIVAITLTILLGQALFGSTGFVLAGQSLRVAMQCGFSMAQIGEFAFIIASLGVSLGVTSSHLYPIVVAVSVITTFLTPYMIRLSGPAYVRLERRLPVKWKTLLERYAGGDQTATADSGYWHTLIFSLLKLTGVYSVLCVAVILLMFHGAVPLLRQVLPESAVSYVCCVLTLLFLSPFLRAIVMKKNHSAEFKALWQLSRFNRLPLFFTILVRAVWVLLMVCYVITHFINLSVGLILLLAVGLVAMMVLSRRLKKHSIALERTFMQNLRSREIQSEHLGRTKPLFATRLLSRDLHLSMVDVPADSQWGGKTLKELSWGRRYGVHVSSILRGQRRINIPTGEHVIYPGDRLQVIGTDEQLETFVKVLQTQVYPSDPDLEEREMILRQLEVDEHSVFLGKSIRESGIRDTFHCMVVGLELGEQKLQAPDLDVPLKAGDLVWVVGEVRYIRELLK